MIAMVNLVVFMSAGTLRYFDGRRKRVFFLFDKISQDDVWRGGYALREENSKTLLRIFWERSMGHLPCADLLNSEGRSELA